MKTVYERPNVHFEAFAANEAVSACGVNTNVTFDCLKGPQKDEYGVLSSALGITCTGRDAGFADYIYEYENGIWKGQDTTVTTDDITSSVVGTFNNHSNYSTYLTWNNETHTVDVKETYKDKFLGWLYLSGNNGDTSMDTSGWSISDGALKFDRDDCNKKHAMLAPVFNLDINTSM